VQQYVVFTAATVPPENRSFTPVMQIRPERLLIFPRTPVIREGYDLFSHAERPITS
jgi:hypothetical protein